jgi:hypothetical protein
MKKVTVRSLFCNVSRQKRWGLAALLFLSSATLSFAQTFPPELTCLDEADVEDGLWTNPPQRSYIAAQAIATTGSYVVQPTDVVVFYATKTITLNQGFIAQKGSDFKAKYMSCINVSGGPVRLSSDDNVQITTNTSRLTIFPNPSEDFIHYKIEGNVQDGSYVEVYNSSGTKIYQETVNTTAGTNISLSNQLSGLYYLRLVSGNDVVSQPFIIK